MTEQDWLTSGRGHTMLAFVQTATTPVRTRWQGWRRARRFPVSERKVRLAEVACCLRIAALVPTEALRDLIGLARLRAEGKAHPCDLRAGLRLLEGVTGRDEFQVVEMFLNGWAETEIEAVEAVARLLRPTSDPDDGALARAASARATHELAVHPGSADARPFGAALAAEQARQAELVRDVIGNPFRPERLEPAWLGAHDRAAARIAEGIAERGAFCELPVLADALEDAGCTSEAVLAHCREPGPHAAGCWALDLALGRE